MPEDWGGVDETLHNYLSSSQKCCLADVLKDFLEQYVRGWNGNQALRKPSFLLILWRVVPPDSTAFHSWKR